VSSQQEHPRAENAAGPDGGGPQTAGTPPSTGDESSNPSGASRIDRRRLAIIAAVVLIAVVGAVAAVISLSRGGNTKPKAAPSSQVVSGGVMLPTVIGAGLSLAQSTLQSEGFTVRVLTRTGPSPAGQVLAQQPAGDQAVQAGTVVTLTVSDGSR
jgi:serine/threonine-protein kinase